jgi:uncharacterized membrane protein HdeD (DUF308 family)
MACFVICLFFLRFWKKTRDRFFLFFAVSFALEGVNRIILGLDYRANENEPVYYLVRLLSFVLILIAIIDKNRITSSHPTQ